jgi:hypothetical protein
MEFDSVLAIVSWPISVSKESGLYFLADTIYSLIAYKYTKKSAVCLCGKKKKRPCRALQLNEL